MALGQSRAHHYQEAPSSSHSPSLSLHNDCLVGVTHVDFERALTLHKHAAIPELHGLRVKLQVMVVHNFREGLTFTLLSFH